jgi:eukaryotic-like serine/threonine-protein kinase
MRDHSSTAKSIFLNALEISSAEARQTYIAAQCGGDESLGGEVEALLRQHGELGSFLEAPAANDVTELGNSSLREGAGTIVGPYKLLQQIGEGGMGVVFMAEQQRPVQRMVALKIIKPGMDTRQVIARFEAERQALALMDHPNIAKVLDAGATESGRPYFVMELVKGMPITQYCDEHHLTPGERLGLFVPVCQAVQHAHQKGIIHRDLKPSNVMIALYDGRPVPKIIDFGVAKATGRKLTERTMFTEYGAVVGTVEYMSPEQAELNQLDIDTRSDIYSLGVLLYELLTSMTPFDKSRLRSAAFMEMLRIIREEDPPKPSTRLSTTKELATIAADRGLEPRKLSGAMRGDLDWIVMKCLEKDRNRRYETANGVAMDVQRFLDGEPVLAVPPSATYRLRKFLRKNRALLATTAAIVALLVVGIAVSTWQAIRATRAESVAVENETKAEQERQIAEAVRKFLDVDLLSQADPGAQADALISAGGMSEDSKQNPTIRELLDRAAAELATDRIEKHFPNQPLVQAEILRTVGGTYLALGECPKAIEMLKRSTELFQRFRGVDHPRTLSSMGELALAYEHVEAIDLARPLAEQTLRLWKAKPDRSNSDMIRAMGILADIYSELGLREKSVESMEEAYQLAKTTLGSNNEQTLIMMRELAKIYSRADRNDLATPLMEQALQLDIANLGSDHVVTLMGMYSLAHLYEQSGKLELALPLCEENVRLSAAKLGAEHPDTLLFKSDLGYLYRVTGKLDKSMTILEETFQIMKRKLGPNHAYTLRAMINLAATYRDAGKLELGLPLQEEVLRLQRSKQGDAHPYTKEAKDQLATMYVERQKLDRGVPLLEEQVALAKKNLGPSDLGTLVSIKNLALLYLQQGKTELAVSSYEEVVKLTKAKLGPENSETVGAMERLAEVYLDAAARQAWLTEHKKWEETCQTAIRFAEGANNPVILERAAKACSLSPTEDSEQHAKGLVLARKAVELGKKHQWLPYFQLTLGMAEYRSGHYQEADAALDSASKSVKRKGQLDNIAAFYHAMSLFHQGKQDEARKIAASTAAKMKPLPKDERIPQPHDDLIEWLAYKEAKAMMP